MKFKLVLAALLLLAAAWPAYGHGNHVAHGIHEIKLHIRGDRIDIDYTVLGKNDPRHRLNLKAQAEKLIGLQSLKVDNIDMEINFIDAQMDEKKAVYAFSTGEGSIAEGSHRVNYAALSYKWVEQVNIRVRPEEGATLVPGTLKMGKDWERRFQVDVDGVNHLAPEEEEPGSAGQ